MNNQAQALASEKLDVWVATYENAESNQKTQEHYAHAAQTHCSLTTCSFTPMPKSFQPQMSTQQPRQFGKIFLQRPCSLSRTGKLQKSKNLFTMKR